MSPYGYKVCTVTDATTQLVSVHINGRRVVYYGKRDVLSLSRFVQQLDNKLTSLPYEVIATKMDKKAFEHVIVPKVVGFFHDNSSAHFASFVEAARQLSPNIPFYVVHDPRVGSHFFVVD